MVSALTLPRLVFGSGCISGLTAELALLGVSRPLLISDRGLEKAGIVAKLMAELPQGSAQFLDVPENPTAAGADAALARYRRSNADGVVALGGGSVLDTAKLVAALAGGKVPRAAELIGKPDLIGPEIVQLAAIPTTLGTGSESSPVSSMHFDATGGSVGTRSFRLVPKLAVCDPDLTRTLPRRLIAATGIDALSHCIEGFFAEPENPFIDALALDGVARVFADLHAALEPEGDAARASLMAAAYAGGIAIHKGLGPAHAIALACSDQDVHHGTLIGVALPAAVALVAPHLPAKAARVCAALGLRDGSDLGAALRDLIVSVGLPGSLRQAGYSGVSVDQMTGLLLKSPFNRSSPYVPKEHEFRQIATDLLA
jgi:4-hydroxybutyrate dehydrogenase